MKYDTATPFIASYVLVRRRGKIAFVLRSNTKWMNGYYGLPSGKVEQNEAYSQAAVREAREEIGIAVKQSGLRHVLTMHRQEGDEAMTWVDVFFEAEDWQGEPYNAEPHVHSELSWFDLNNLPENVIPSVRFALERIAAGEHYCEYGWK